MDESKYLTQSPLLLEIKNLHHGFSHIDLPPKERNFLQARTATVHQVHHNTIEWTDHLRKARAPADAVGTATPGLPVGVYTADCAPILLVSMSNGKALGVMAVHAGWRGTALGIANKAIEALWKKAPGSELFAAIGPSISQAAFEVGEEVIAAFPESEVLGLARFLRQEGHRKKYLFDLPGENARQIKAAAARLKIPVQIDLLAECTFHRGDLYPSFRRDKEAAGRMLSFVELVP